MNIDYNQKMVTRAVAIDKLDKAYTHEKIEFISNQHGEIAMSG